MLLFFWTDIKDLALFCHLKENDKIQKRRKRKSVTNWTDVRSEDPELKTCFIG